MRKSLLVVPLLVAGCQTWGPTWSEVSGASYYHRAIADRQPAIIASIDGAGVLTPPFKVDPGEHEVGVQSPPHDRFHGSMKTMHLAMAPCKRYYVNAQFAGRVGPEWEPVVDYVEDVAGCGSNPKSP